MEQELEKRVEKLEEQLDELHGVLRSFFEAVRLYGFDMSAGPEPGGTVRIRVDQVVDTLTSALKG